MPALQTQQETIAATSGVFGRSLLPLWAEARDGSLFPKGARLVSITQMCSLWLIGMIRSKRIGDSRVLLTDRLNALLL